MGNFYKNLTVIGPKREAVEAALTTHQRAAYLTPTRDGITVIFDLESDEAGDPAPLGDLALTLSHDLACVALAVAVYDDDVLLIGLYDRGTQLGEYNSSEASTLRASVLARAFDVRARTPLLWALLGAPHVPLFIFESFRHSLLIRALRMPRWAFATGYKYIQQGEPPPDLAATSLTHVGVPRPWHSGVT